MRCSLAARGGGGVGGSSIERFKLLPDFLLSLFLLPHYLHGKKIFSLIALIPRNSSFLRWYWHKRIWRHNQETIFLHVTILSESSLYSSCKAVLLSGDRVSSFTCAWYFSPGMMTASDGTRFTAAAALSALGTMYRSAGGLGGGLDAVLAGAPGD